ncbi:MULTISPECIES: HepT-like ribonuclease domain-containing protein [unclassified Marinomonas]|uniref:Nucleotidyltransferase n=1 Tax=Marinomonas sp. (strain MWYL1) TaxID=400668 RepID=A6VZR4_MARMS
MFEAGQREWRLYIDDMIGFAEKVLSYTEGMNQASFISNNLAYDATLRNIELIGEAATHIPDTIRSENSDIPWRMIVATRNRLIHGYLGVDDDILWSIIVDEIPALLSGLRIISASTIR